MSDTWLHRAVRALVENIAGPTGLVLALDDLHWADDSSLELLDHLMRHPPRAPVLLALAYRPRQASARLLGALAEAGRRGLATTIEVGPLTAAEAGDLLPAELGPARHEQLLRAAGGNPFYLEVLARGGEADRGPVDAALAGEFAALDPRCRRLVHAAAVAGDEFDPALVGAVAELSELRRPGRAGGHRSGGTSSGRGTHRAGSGSAIRCCAARRTTMRARGGASVRTPEPRQSWVCRKAPMDVRAPHIEASAATGDLAAVELLRAAATEAMPATPAAAAHWLGLGVTPAAGGPGRRRHPPGPAAPAGPRARASPAGWTRAATSWASSSGDCPPAPTTAWRRPTSWPCSRT